MKKLFALLLLSPLAFANTIDLHCENDKYSRAFGVNAFHVNIIQLDIENTMLANVSHIEVKQFESTLEDKPVQKVVFDKIDALIKINIDTYEWYMRRKGFDTAIMFPNGGVPHLGTGKFRLLYQLNRQTLKLKAYAEFFNNMGDLTDWTVGTNQCEIIDNVSEKISYYKNKHNEYNAKLKKIEERELKKNKI
tara:strand:- start:2603 stop:3178 length:576 start_codon:yes stop_codon:yes gene_type:complete